MWIWPSVEGELCISCHMRLKRPLFPSGWDRGWGKLFITVSYTWTEWLQNSVGHHHSLILELGNATHRCISLSLRVDRPQHGHLFHMALWMTWVFLGVVDHNCSQQSFPTRPSCSRLTASSCVKTLLCLSQSPTDNVSPFPIKVSSGSVWNWTLPEKKKKTKHKTCHWQTGIKKLIVVCQVHAQF